MARMAQTSSTSLKHMWETRPRRITKDQGGRAVFGGVCTGFGARYGYDPVAVRIAFVLTGFFFGGGIFAYLLCWLLMPRLGEDISPGRAIFTRKDQRSPIEQKECRTGWLLLLGLIIFIPAAADAGDNRVTFGVFVVLLFIWLFAYASNPTPPEQWRDDDLVWRDQKRRRRFKR